jgi:hypothetical protein
MLFWNTGYKSSCHIIFLLFIKNILLCAKCICLDTCYMACLLFPGLLNTNFNSLLKRYWCLWVGTHAVWSIPDAGVKAAVPVRNFEHTFLV